MRTALSLDDVLVAKARAYTGIEDTTDLVHAALVALIEHESARRLTRLGGSERAAKAPRRRRARAATADAHDGTIFPLLALPAAMRRSGRAMRRPVSRFSRFRARFSIR